LKGKMGVSIGQTSDKVIGAIIKTKGEELVRKLKAQEIKLYSIEAPGLGRRDRRRRDRRVSGDISDPYTARSFQGRPGGMGSHGSGSDQRRECRHRGSTAASPRRVAHGRFSSKP